MLKFTIHNAIESFQTGKKIFVDAVVKHEGLAKTMNSFVDAQTEYTKKAVDAGLEATNNVYKTITDKSFYSDSAKIFQETVKSTIDILKKGK